MLFLSACSSKEYYKPTDVSGTWKKGGNSGFEIIDSSLSAALLENGKVLVGDKTFNYTLPKNSTFLGYSDGWIISSTIDGMLTLTKDDNSISHKFSLKKTVATASVQKDVLAVLFANNEAALYSIETKALILKEQGDPSIVVNSKIIQPYFRDDIVIFSTLDGKIIIVSAQEKKRLRSVIVGVNEHFNNVIYLNLMDNKIIAATGYKILSLAQKELRANHDIRSVVADEKSIFLATKQGEIISLTTELNQNAKLKFAFAHFLGMIVTNDKLYALEKSGYLIEMAKDLSHYKVYKADIEDGHVYVSGKTFYTSDEQVSVE